jgi:uncharacterized protein YecE (DUF72 family)
VTATRASLAGLYVGTSGWSYPSWKPGFYPAGTKAEDFLRYYAERFPTVELNTTGYRLPREELFERWAEQTPPGFRFAPKLNAHPRTDFGTFADRVRLLGERLGPIRILVAAARDEGLLTLVLGSFDPSLSLALDFRHDTWDGIEDELPAPARAALRRGGAPRGRRAHPSAARCGYSHPLLLQARGRADGSLLRARAARRAGGVTFADADLHSAGR